MEAPLIDGLGLGAPPGGKAKASAKVPDHAAPEASRSGLRGAGATRVGHGAWLADLALLALFAIALRSPTFSIAVINWDESAFILAAREVLLGHLPYGTFWDHKPPGSTMIIAAAMAAFGESVETVRVLGLACVVATAWSLHAITSRIVTDRPTALAAALLYVAFSTRLDGLASMIEILMAPFSALGALLLLLALERRGDLALFSTFAAAGLAFGVAIWIKYVPAVPAAVIGGFVLVSILLRRDTGFVRVVAFGAVFAAGLLLPTLASVLVFWQHGALDSFLYANFGFAARYHDLAGHSKGALFAKLRWATIAAVQIWPLALLAAAALLPPALAFFRHGSRRQASALVGIWLVCEFVAVALQGRFYGYQFLVTLPPLCVAAAATLRAYASYFALPSKAATVAAVAAGFVALMPIVPQARETMATLSRPDVAREVAWTVRGELAPGDLVYVVNHEPIIYFLAGAPLPTRYAFPVLLSGYHHHLMDTDPLAERRRIFDARPKFVVMNESWRENPDFWDPQAMLHAEEVLARHYTPRASWVLPSSLGILRVFALRD